MRLSKRNRSALTLFLSLSLFSLSTLNVYGQTCYGWGNVGSGYCDDICEDGVLVADYSGNCAADVRPHPTTTSTYLGPIARVTHLLTL
jgi:hypothetical protein